MNLTNLARRHWAALRALAVLTVLLGVGYPALIWLVGQLPGLQQRADGSLLTVDGAPVASALIGQSFTDPADRALPQYLQGRPSTGGYRALDSGASNLGPEDVVDTADRPSLLTQVCTRSVEIGRRDGVDGSRPFCTPGGVGAVLAVFGPRDTSGAVPHPTRAVSVNEFCTGADRPFLPRYLGVPVGCAEPGRDYSAGLIVPIRGDAPANPAVPPDAVTASASGLDPDISPAYAEIQIDRVARARHRSPDEIRAVVQRHRTGRTLGFLGEPRVNVVAVNLDLDRSFPPAS